MTKTQIMFCIIFLLNTAFMVDGTKNVNGIALVNDDAKLWCTLEKLQNLTKWKIDIYWQRGEEVLNFMSLEKENSHISDRYQNRTILEKNGNLTLQDVNFEDQGVYTCILIVIGDKGRKKEDQCTYHLDVHAKYSDPEISYEPSVQIVDNGTNMHFKCSSGHGFPRPQRMIWEISFGNNTKELIKFTEIKNISNTFNASSELSLKVEEDVNITCVLEAHHNATSTVLQIVVKKEILPDIPDWNIIIIISVIIIVCFTAISIALVVRRKKKQSRANITGSSRSQETGSAAGPLEQQTLMSTERETATV